MRVPNYHTFDVKPIATPKKPRNGQPETAMYKEFVRYKQRLAAIAKAKNFNLGDSFKIVFIIPISKKLSEKEQFELIGQPHNIKGYYLPKLVDGVIQALFPEGKHPFRVDAAKYWGDASEAKVIIRNIVLEDFEYLRQVK